ncbi:MAG: PKD domain-containing protein, partial [Bacteriovorax sp.]|nr:PKD domain-containing protein [Bacteriovorax sp.]
THEVAITDSDVAIMSPNASFGYRIYDFAQNVSFYNDKSGTPNGSIISYLWDFGDGQTATGQKIAHFYNPGSYFVTLTVVDTAGLRSSETQHVTIYQTGSDLIADVDCSLAEPFVEFTQQCKVTALDKQGQISKVRLTWGDGTVAVNLNLTAAQGINKPTHNYAAVGTYPIRLSVFTSRGETKTMDTSVTLVHNVPPAPPVAAINCSSSLLTVNCSANGSYDPNNSILSYIYNWGDGASETSSTQNLNHTYSSQGNYQVILTVKNSSGATAIATQNISIISTSIIASLNCYTNNLLVSCNALGSYDLTGSPLTYNFSYGDLFTEENANGISSHAYSSAGLFTVNLKVTNSNGEIATAQVQVQPVKPPNQLPVPNLFCYSVAPNILRCSASRSVDNDGTIISYKYDWDDNTSETHGDEYVIFHIFPNGGNHQVTLTATDNDGGVSSVTNTFDVQVNHPPVAGVSCYTSGPQRVHCDSNSYDQDPYDMIPEYKWDLGDGHIFTSMIPSVDYTYSASSTYTISLQVKDLMGATASVSQDITIIENQAPIANIYCFITTGTTYQCNSNAYDPDGQVVSQVWTISGSSLSGSSVVYNFTNGGDYPVTFTITDDLGKQVAQVITIHVNSPIADFLCNETSPLHLSCHYVKSVNDPKNIISVRYFIDDRDVFEVESFEYDFLASGSHKILLTSFADDGTRSIVEKTITINSHYFAPLASFTSFADINLKVKFDSSDSFKQGRKVTNFKWDFGDGSVENTIEGEIFHSYQNIGNYNVILTVTDDQGNINSITKSTNVYDSEVPDPGDINSDTLEGIDLDNDGVRDDVQRWINFEAKDNLDVKNLLRKLALNYQIQIVNNTDSVKVIDSEVKKNKITTCLLGKVSNDVLVGHYQGMFQYLYTSTEIRSKAWSLVQGNLGGSSSVAPPIDQVTRLLSCEGI